MEKHLHQIDGIINSVNELILSLRKVKSLDDNLYFTITEIINFIGRILEQMPEIMMSKDKFNFFKSDIITSFKTVQLSWKLFDYSKEIFFRNWDSFTANWKIYHEQLNKVAGSLNTVYLSMN